MATVGKRAWTYNGEAKTAWVLRYIDTLGKRRQETFETKRAADRRRIEVESAVERGTHVAARETCSIKILVEGFIADCERRQKIGDRMGATCLYNYKLIAKNHIVSHLGDIRAQNITAAQVQDWLDGLSLKYGTSTLERCSLVLNLAIKYGMRRHLVGRNVFAEGGIRVPNRTKKKIKIPTREQITAILNHRVERVRYEERKRVLDSSIVVHLGLLCGMRASEIAGLDWQSVDLEGGKLEIVQAKSALDGLKGPKSQAGYRREYLSPATIEVFKALPTYRGQASTGPIVLSQTGERYNPAGIWRLWQTAARRVGLVDENRKGLFRLHDLRHAAISLMIGEGLSPMHVKTFAGHARISTTIDTYGHLFPDDASIQSGAAAIAGRLSMAQGSRKNA